jgi:hypothetical protein
VLVCLFCDRSSAPGGAAAVIACTNAQAYHMGWMCKSLLDVRLKQLCTEAVASMIIALRLNRRRLRLVRNLSRCGLGADYQ